MHTVSTILFLRNKTIHYRIKMVVGIVKKDSFTDNQLSVKLCLCQNNITYPLGSCGCRRGHFKLS